jgi:hypothetical protein
LILHVEADVIDDAMAGRCLGGIGLGEANLHAQNAVHHRSIIASAGSAAEGLGVPRCRCKSLSVAARCARFVPK